MKKDKNEDVQHFLTRNGEMYPIPPNDPIIKRFEPKDKRTGEVLDIKLYPKDLHVSDSNKQIRVVRAPELEDEEDGGKKRSEVRKFSYGSTKRFKFVMRNIAHLMEVTITLTYPKEFPMNGKIVKAHLKRFLGWLRDRNYKNVWVLEFQERGAPHFHILIDKEIPHQDVAKHWYKIVGSGDEKHLRAGTQTARIQEKHGMGVYMSSYLNKIDQKQVPEQYEHVGRFWGCSKGLLQNTHVRLYGNKEDILLLKEKLKVARQFDRAQKKSWERNRKAKGKKNKFKKFYYGYTGYSLKLTNSDKFQEELEKRSMDTFPFTLRDTAKLAPLPPVAERGKRKTKKEIKEEERIMREENNQKLF